MSVYEKGLIRNAYKGGSTSFGDFMSVHEKVLNVKLNYDYILPYSHHVLEEIQTHKLYIMYKPTDLSYEKDIIKLIQQKYSYRFKTKIDPISLVKYMWSGAYLIKPNRKEPFIIMTFSNTSSY